VAAQQRQSPLLELHANVQQQQTRAPTQDEQQTSSRRAADEQQTSSRRAADEQLTSSRRAADEQQTSSRRAADEQQTSSRRAADEQQTSSRRRARTSNEPQTTRTRTCVQLVEQHHSHGPAERSPFPEPLLQRPLSARTTMIHGVARRPQVTMWCSGLSTFLTPNLKIAPTTAMCGCQQVAHRLQMRLGIFDIHHHNSNKRGVERRKRACHPCQD